MCVCVCVCVREREREIILVGWRTDSTEVCSSLWFQEHSESGPENEERKMSVPFR